MRHQGTENRQWLQTHRKLHGHWVWQSSYLIMGYLHKHPLESGQRIMDIGCGWGLLDLLCQVFCRPGVAGGCGQLYILHGAGFQMVNSKSFKNPMYLRTQCNCLFVDLLEHNDFACPYRGGGLPSRFHNIYFPLIIHGNIAGVVHIFCKLGDKITRFIKNLHTHIKVC